MSSFFESNSQKSDRRRTTSPPRSSIITPVNSPPRRFSSPITSSGGKSGSKTQDIYSDRFIPSRTSSNLEDGFESLGYIDSNEQLDRNDSSRENHGVMNNLLRSELLGQSLIAIKPDTDAGFNTSSITSSPDRRDSISSSGSFGGSTNRPSTNMLRYKSLSISSDNGGSSSSELSPQSFGSKASNNQHSSSPRKNIRKIPRTPFKVLDAPSLQDDYYLNLVDWSSSNVLSVALGSSVYLWSACTSKVTKLCDLSGTEESVTSISWALSGNQIAVGTNSGHVQIWDASRCQKVRDLSSHSSRVGSLAWNSTLLASGSRDRNIFLQDIRIRGGGGTAGINGRGGDEITPDSCVIQQLSSHKQEVCGLKWSFDERMLASGGNDNKLYVWSPQQADPTIPMCKFEDHTAAVKAVAWSPHQHGLLASGGGTADRCIRFWNALSGTAMHKIDTGSQVCNLMWSKNVNEIVSTHGYSLNQIIVWRYPTMQKLTTLTGHALRVLYLAMSPDGQSVVTGAGDETLRFWNLFPSSRSSIGTRIGSSSLLLSSGSDIR